MYALGESDDVTKSLCVEVDDEASFLDNEAPRNDCVVSPSTDKATVNSADVARETLPSGDSSCNILENGLSIS